MDWGFPGFMGGGTGPPMQPGLPSSVAPATADVIAQQSQVTYYFCLLYIVIPSVNTNTMIQYDIYCEYVKMYKQYTYNRRKNIHICKSYFFDGPDADVIEKSVLFC